MRLVAGCWLFAMLSFSIAAQPVDQSVTILFPEDDEIAGWERDGDTYVAHDEGSLSEFINGAAPFYIDHGAIEVGFQDYMSGDTFLNVELYRMAESGQAEQLLADIDVENPEPLTDVHGVGRFVGGYIGVLQIEFWQEHFFIRLNVSDKSEASRDALFAFALNISDQIENQKSE